MRRPAFACKMTRKMLDLVEQGAASKVELRVFFLLAGDMNGSNLVNTSLNRLLKAGTIDRKAAYKALSALESMDWVRKDRVGYFINPTLVWRGGDRQWTQAIDVWQHGAKTENS